MLVIDQPDRVIVAEGEDFALFLKERPGVFSGHYFFEKAKGRQAINLANRILDKMFGEVGAEVILGLTPVENKAACWITRQLGFTEQGTVDQPDVGPAKIYTLTKDEYKGKSRWAA